MHASKVQSYINSLREQIEKSEILDVLVTLGSFMILK